MKGRAYLTSFILVFVSVMLVVLPYAANAQEKELRFLTREVQGQTIEVTNKIIADFEKLHPGVKVVLERVSLDQMEQKMIAAIQAGRGYDIIQGPLREMSGILGARGILLPLNDVVDALGREDYVKGLLPDFWGNNYQIPYWAGGCGLWYRNDLFEENGLEPPDTWNEMLEAAKILIDL